MSVEVFPEQIFCGLLAYDSQTRHPNEVSRTASRETSTANIVLSSMQDSLSHQTTWIETICSDLEEIRDRLAAVEAAMEMTAKEGENTAGEGKATGRRRRS